MKKVKIGALKVKERENALNEVRLLASISHPNIIGYKEVFMEESTNTMCIVMEIADSGDLLQKIQSTKKRGGQLTERELWSILGQLINGLKALHDMKILHRDLK
jgi:NIMA (never in mitosis gene a)-related kinase